MINELEKLLNSTLESIAEEPWTSKISVNELEYFRFLEDYKKLKGPRYKEFEEKYTQLINIKEQTELQRIKRERE